MDFGQAKFILSKRLNLQLCVVASQRQLGLSYIFHKNTGNYYVCASCKKLGKARSITVREGRIVGKSIF
jgi:hypothetical protein